MASIRSRISGRTLPFGSGATIFFNYGDLRLGNPTSQAFQLRVRVGTRHLNGAISTEREWPLVYHVEERDHRFTRADDGAIYRDNELWQRVVDRRTGQAAGTSLITRNHALVKYPVAPGGARSDRARGEPRRARLSVLASIAVEPTSSPTCSGERVASGRLYHEFIRTHDLSVGAVRAARRRHGPAEPAHRGRGLLRGLRAGRRSRVGDEDRPVRQAPSCSSAPTWRTGSTTSRRSWSCSCCSARPSTRTAPTTRAAARTGPPRAELAAGGNRQLQRELRRPTNRVVAEEDVHVVAGREERLDPSRPCVERGRVVVVAAQAQVQERARSADERRLGSAAASARRRAGRARALVALGRQLGRAQDGADVAQRGERLVDVPRRILELHHERDRARPRREERREPGIGDRGIAADTHGPSRRTSAGTRNRTAPSRSPNAGSGSVSQATLSSGAPDRRAERGAALGLRRESELRRRRPDPARDRGRGRAGAGTSRSARARAGGRRSTRGDPPAACRAGRSGASSRGTRTPTCRRGGGRRGRSVRPVPASRRPGRRRTASSARPSRGRRRRSPTGSSRRCRGGASARRSAAGSRPASVSAASAPRRSLEQRDAGDEAVVDEPVDQAGSRRSSTASARRRGGPSAAAARATRPGSAARRTPGATGRARRAGPRPGGARRAPGRVTNARHGARRGSRGVQRLDLGRGRRTGIDRPNPTARARCTVNDGRRRGAADRLASADMTTFDVDAIRARFPALSLTHDGRPMVFFDGPGGTQVPESVIDAVAGYYRESNANHGGAFPTSERSDAIVEDAHAALADLLGVDADEITLGPNMTTLTFHISRSIAAAMRPGDEIVVTGLDHQANVDPWIAAARDNEVIVRTWEPRPRRLHAAARRPRRRPQRADEARRRRLGLERRRHDQPDRRDREARPRGRARGSTSTRSTRRRTCRSTRGRSTPTSSPARSTSSSGRTSARCTAGARSASAADVQGSPGASTGSRPGTGNFEGYAGAARRRRVPRRPRAALRRRGRRRELGARRSPPGCARSAPTRWTSTATSREARGDRRRQDPRPHRRTRTWTAGRRRPRSRIDGRDAARRRRAPRRQGIAVWDGDFYATGLIERLGPRARRRRPDRADALQHAAPRSTGSPTELARDRRRDRGASAARSAARAMSRRCARRCSRRPARRSEGPSRTPPTASCTTATSRSRSASTPPSPSCSTRSGTTVHLLDVEIDSPDLLYAYDPLIVTDRGAIPLRPGKPNRVPEAAGDRGAGRAPTASRRVGRDRGARHRSRAATRSGSGRTCSASGGRCGPTRPARTSSRRSSAATSGSSTSRTGRARRSSST